MKIVTKATNLKLTPDIERYLSKKLTAVGKLISHDDTTAASAIELERTTKHHQKGKIFRAEVNMHAEIGNFRAEGFGTSIQAAIDEMRDGIEIEIKRGKEKKIAEMRSGARKVKELRKQIF